MLEKGELMRVRRLIKANRLFKTEMLEIVADSDEW
jgi:hypothetical protein